MTEQLAGMDAAFLSLETPESPMHMIGVLLLDPAGGEGFSPAMLRRVFADRLHLMPPFCRRLVEVPLALDKPYWTYDTEINLSRHLHEVTLEPPGDLHALSRVVGAIAEELLPRDRPLWELHLIDGLADGRYALVAKVHHSTLYGVAGAEFIAELLDLSPEIAEKPPRQPGERITAPGPITMARRTAASLVRIPVTTGGLLLSAARNAASTVQSVGSAVRSRGRDALPSLAPRLPISGAPTARRSVGFTALSLDRVKQVKDAAGVTVNDAVLAVVALAVGRYLAARDLSVRSVVAGVPMNAGEGQASGTNTLATMMVTLPLDVTEPAELLPAVHESAVAAKEFTAAIGATLVGDLAEVTMPAAMQTVTWLTRSLGLATLQPSLINLVVSNVMGPPIPLYLAGARVDAIFPMGPLLAGAGMNVTVLSNLDRLDVGIMACSDLVEDVWEIADSLPDCLEQLAARL